MATRRVIIVRLLLTAGLALVLLTSDEFLGGSRATRLGLGALVVVVCAAVLLVDTERGRPWFSPLRRLSRAALVVLSLSGVLTCSLLPNGAGVAVPLVVSRVASQARVPTWSRHGMLVVSALSLTAYGVVSHGPWWGYLAWPVAVVVVFQSGLRVQSRRQQLEAAELLLAQEQALREEHVRSAAAAERARITRELHDVLAHTLSGLTVTLQATAVLLEAEGASAAAREQVGRARALAVDGLVEARTAVASLAASDDEPVRVDLVAAVGRQVREHEVTTGAEAALDVVSAPVDPSPDVVGAVSGIVREALTNAVRHAPGRPVRVVLDAEQGRLAVVVEVDEGGPAASAGSGGMGLAGMRARAVEVGGELAAGPYAEGWRVSATLPLHDEAVGRG
ncbi:MAG: sensor histidine kinase [Janthinobacterium lividum]